MSRADADRVREFLSRAAFRLAGLALLEGAAAGLVVAAFLAMLGWPPRGSGVTPLAIGVILLVVGALVRFGMTRQNRAQVALSAERAAPECRNLLVTAAELAAKHAADRGPAAAAGTSGYVAAEVMRRAALLVARLDMSALFPVGRRAAIGAAVALVWVASLARATDGRLAGRITSATPMIDLVEVVVVAPEYTGQPVRGIRDPDRVEVLEGSRISFRVHTNADSVIFSTLDTSLALSPDSAAGRFVGSLVATNDGFISLEPRTGIAGARRLIGYTVTADAAPRARIVAPGRDQVLANGRQAIDVAIEAEDDIALASLSLRYTRVSGAGERFTFVEGEVPLSVTRIAGRSWKASARWRLDSLALEPGDMVVYRAAVADGRPGSVPVESDAFIAEVAAPGGVAAGGFATDPDQERYALSQQMIVLKLERLLAARPGLDSAAYADSAAEIASEQRRVRAEFVFMMGGEMGDGAVEEENLSDLNEEAEAAAEMDLLAGREANLGRLALRAATRAMSRAARALTQMDVPLALAQAKAAVVQLELAFARNRIILRALAEREELDPVRRLSGELLDVARSRRAVVPAGIDSRVVALRAALLDVGVLSATLSGAVSGALGRASAESGVEPLPSMDRDISLVAERVLRIDPSAQAMQDAARALSAASTAAARRDAGVVGESLGRASLTIAGELRRLLPLAHGAGGSLEGAASRGAISDLLRAARPR